LESHSANYFGPSERCKVGVNIDDRFEIHNNIEEKIIHLAGIVLLSLISVHLIHHGRNGGS
jgi:hypothetical protein